ncbi:protein-disulfide reductase DsbD domain-containing protein [Dyadobacter chenhuakuii]|uniref:Protein-disulfide reductase DsbD N-terminal domain-containing protein n=1 Tax=Dyadobacter chenhuakuii TaxID=2909339 RepID=A0A9X1QFP4_9BACT|nr:protein-disulfide reductase DsbD domain-containing protein [Dyadobacter chenhuakuii]MCF2498919.1 protein-disulfide reductase DsbD N-terminal domain-containing protein [Dyadobacter chenhuakuii]
MLFKQLFFLFLLTSVNVFAQEPSDISKWNVSVSSKNAKAGEEVELIFSASIDKNWKLYSSDFKNEIGPLPTEFKFVETDSYQLIGTINPIQPKKTTDPTWDVQYTYFTEKAQFRQKIKVSKNGFNVAGTIKGLLCSNEDGLCIPFQESFRIN